jgi:hypothetical protein
MGMPIRARLDERDFLDLAGIKHHGEQSVWIFVEDTSERPLRTNPWCEDDCDECPYNFQPRMVFEITDGEDVVRLGFDIDVEEGRTNSLHKLDTLAAAVSVFRSALTQEFEHYDRRERELAAVRGE